MEKKDKRTRIAYIIEAGAEYFISLFVTGTFLVYILDAVGFSDALKGILSTVASFTCCAQLFALFLSGKQVKRIVTVGHLLNQLAFVLLYLLPIFNISPTAKTVLLLVFLICGHLLNNAVNPSKITWLMAAVPDTKRGSFTAVKEMISLAGGMIVSLVLGRLADTFCVDGVPTSTYYIICCIALFLLMGIHTLTLLISHEKPTPNSKKIPVGTVVKKLVRNKDLIKVSMVGILWSVASGISGGFFASYSMKELGFSMTTIALMSTIGSVCRIAVSPAIGRIADKKSFSYSMTLCFGIVAVAYIAQGFAAPGWTRWLHLVYLCLHAFAMAGINSGVINLIYDYVVPEERAVALGVKNSISGIVVLLMALVGGVILANIQDAGGFKIFGVNLYAQQVLAFITFFLSLGVVAYLRLVVAPLKRVCERDAKEEEEICQGQNNA